MTVSRLAQSRRGSRVSYRGVSDCLSAHDNSLGGGGSGSGGVDGLNAETEWLDSLVTASELLKAFASRSLPPARFLKEHFNSWSQRRKQAVLETPHPVLEGATGFARLLPGTRASAEATQAHQQQQLLQNPSPLKRLLSRQRAHSRTGDDSAAAAVETAGAGTAGTGAAPEAVKAASIFSRSWRAS
jgi:hypothetical protein